MAKVTAVRSLSLVDGGRRVTLKPGDTATVSDSKAKRLAAQGFVTVAPKPKPKPKAKSSE